MLLPERLQRAVATLTGHPDDPLLGALFCHPVFAALSALDVYYRGRAPLVERVRTVREFADRLADVDRQLRVFRSVEPHDRRTARALLFHELRNDIPDHVRESLDNLPLSRRDSAVLKEFELENFVSRTLAECEEHTLRLRAGAFSYLLWKGPPAWRTAMQILGRSRPAGRRIPAEPALSHWKDVHRSIALVISWVRRRPRSALAALLFPQEQDYLREHRQNRVYWIAAYFTWERAGRPGSLSTFAHAVGVDIRPNEMDVESPLLERYHVDNAPARALVPIRARRT